MSGGGALLVDLDHENGWIGYSCLIYLALGRRWRRWKDGEQWGR